MIDLEGLSKVLDANLDVPESGFDMTVWICGTSECMIGNFISRAKDELYWADSEPCFRGCYGLHAVQKRFGLTPVECDWLFRGDYGIMFRAPHCRVPCGNVQPKWKALSRLAKFIAYKRRKGQLLDDYETARRMEGDHMVVPDSSVGVSEHAFA